MPLIFVCTALFTLSVDQAVYTCGFVEITLGSHKSPESQNIQHCFEVSFLKNMNFVILETDSSIEI